MSIQRPSAAASPPYASSTIVAAAAVAGRRGARSPHGGVPQAQPLVGLIVILGIAYALSTNRRAIDRRTVAWGLGLQVVFALLVLKTDGRAAGVPDGSATASTRLLDFAGVGVALRVRAARRQGRRGRGS